MKRITYCDQCKKDIKDDKLVYFSNREKNLDFCSKNCQLKFEKSQKNTKIGIDFDHSSESKVESSKVGVFGKDADAIGVQINRGQKILVKKNEVKVEGERTGTGIKIFGSSGIDIIGSMVDVRSDGSAVGLWVGGPTRNSKEKTGKQLPKKAELTQKEVEKLQEELQISQFQLQKYKKQLKGNRELNKELKLKVQQQSNNPHLLSLTKEKLTRNEAVINEKVQQIEQLEEKFRSLEKQLLTSIRVNYHPIS